MNGYLDMVGQPGQVKKLTPDQLLILAQEVRQELITKLARNGGHLGPNLGVVELTIALHAVFDTPPGQVHLGCEPPVLCAQAADRATGSFSYHPEHQRALRIRTPE